MFSYGDEMMIPFNNSLRMKPVRRALRICGAVFVLFLSFPLHAEEDQKPLTMHPPVMLLDTDGRLVQESGEPVSTRKSCGKCHDYDFISQGYHSQQGRLELIWWKDRVFPYFVSRGMYGKWCSMPNRQLASKEGTSPEDFDLGTPEWIRGCGTCHVGGGITEFDRRNRKYTEVNMNQISETDPDYHYYSLKKKKLVRWDWEESGIAEVDCFLCHIRNFNRPERDEQIREGYFEWASTATLEGTGIVLNEIGELIYIPGAFNEDGSVKADLLRLDEPAPENCGQCHGFVGLGENENIVRPFFSRELLRGTKKFGRVWSSGKIKNSNVNLEGKEEMDFPWSVHAEKKLKCQDCHFSPNDPARKFRVSRKAGHLKYHPVDSEWEDYLKRPDHNFAKGHAYPESIREEHECTMRTCRECHDAPATHQWLPFREHHFRKVGCATCHIPRKNYWAYKQLDMTLSGTTFSEVRGLAEGEDYKDPNALVTGFQPAYFPRSCKDGRHRITPHNLITSLFWFDTVKNRPAYIRQVNDAFMEYDSLYRIQFKQETIRMFDADGDGKISREELRIDTPEKYAWARRQMEAEGVQEPELRMEILPFSLAHNVVSKNQAIKDCTECHSPDTRLLAPVEVFDFIPDHAHIEVAPVVDVQAVGKDHITYDGKVFYASHAYLDSYYIIGATRWPFVELLGWLSVLGAVFGAAVHAPLRKFPGLLNLRYVFRRKAGEKQ